MENGPIAPHWRTVSTFSTKKEAPNKMIHLHGWFNGSVSFVVCVAVLPIVRHLALRWRLHDPPGPLKIHTNLTPRLGGIALACGIITGVSVAGAGLYSHALSFYLALMLIWLTGLADDLWDLPPAARFAAQIGAGFLVSRTQWSLTIFHNPILDTAATCLFVVVFVNAFNFLDGADGLAAGVTAMVGLGYVVLYSAQAASLGATVAWTLLGSCLGFLLFNFPPAKIFMGDSGSTILGFLVAFLGLDFYRVHHTLGTHLFLPLVFAGLPLLDFILAVSRRLRKRVSLFTGDRGHFYDLLLQKGWAARPVALSAYLATGSLILGGWLCEQNNWLIAVAVLFVVFACISITAIRLGALR
jgi:UDP-GlcNAc:undecaprenyl-phosphate/decaprenyl-phosphate GlcNAc-1-phosphate transferase